MANNKRIKTPVELHCNYIIVEIDENYMENCKDSI